MEYLKDLFIGMSIKQKKKKESRDLDDNNLTRF